MDAKKCGDSNDEDCRICSFSENPPTTTSTI